LKVPDIDAFRTKLDLRDKTAVFIGGLDDAKRLPFLLAAADLCHISQPDFRLIIAGDGSERGMIENAAISRPWLHYLGRAFGAEKAKALAASQVMMMPGRVGLVAVDSFAAGLPIITTDWAYHAPEFEYLQSGLNSLISENEVSAYAAEVQRVLMDDVLLQSLREGARLAAREYSVEAMAANFLRGIQDATSNKR
jgi:glycosyltransferase involved in cell wall biosynthesis